MSGLKKTILCCIVALAASALFGAGEAFAQANDIYNQRFDRNDQTVIQNPFESTDTTSTDKKKGPKKEKKPLESYLFDDSTRVRNMFMWQLNPYNSNVTLRPVDTLMTDFLNDYIFQKKDVGSAYLGNLGGANVPLNYFDIARPADFTFALPFAAYLYTPDNVDYYNVKKPFTQLSYYMAGQKAKSEDQLVAIHAQNISPSTGFNLSYRNNGTKGQYDNQKGKDKNLSIAFNHTGKRLTVHAGYIYNMLNIEENGGIQDDRDVTDTIYDRTENIPVRLTDAKNRFKSNTFHSTESYAISFSKVKAGDFTLADKSMAYIGHSFNYTRFNKQYTDTKTGSGDYYADWHFNPTATYDSIFESLLDNRVFLQIQPYDRDGIIGVFGGGMGYEFHQYYQFTGEQYLYGTKNVRKDGGYIFGNAGGKFRRYILWDASARYNLIGYTSGDLFLRGEVDFSVFWKQRPVTLALALTHDLRTPDYWKQSYYSNHYVWQNSFSKETETRLTADLSVEPLHLYAGAWQSIVTDKVYYGADATPLQHGSEVTVTGVYLRKDFLLGGFHLNNRVLLQWSSSQEVVPVPLLSAYGEYYYEFNVVKNVLRLQVGVDARYNTGYYAPGYNPAVMAFYNQREKELGNYPYLDAFVAGKWKRMRLFFKMQHLNEDMFGTRNYFTVLHYPLNRRVFKMGFSWNFYD